MNIIYFIYENKNVPHHLIKKKLKDKKEANARSNEEHNNYPNNQITSNSFLIISLHSSLSLSLYKLSLS